MPEDVDESEDGEGEDGEGEEESGKEGGWKGNIDELPSSDALDVFEALCSDTSGFLAEPSVGKLTGEAGIIFTCLGDHSSGTTGVGSAGKKTKPAELISPTVMKLLDSAKNEGISIFIRRDKESGLFYQKRDDGAWLPGYTLTAGKVIKKLVMHTNSTLPPAGVTTELINSRVASAVRDRNYSNLNKADFRVNKKEVKLWDERFGQCHASQQSTAPSIADVPEEFKDLYILGTEGWDGDQAQTIMRKLLGKGEDKKKRPHKQEQREAKKHKAQHQEDKGAGVGEEALLEGSEDEDEDDPSLLLNKQKQQQQQRKQQKAAGGKGKGSAASSKGKKAAEAKAKAVLTAGGRTPRGMR